MSADPHRSISLRGRTGSAVLLTAAITMAGLVGPASAASLPFTNCGTRSPATVTGVDVTPHPLQPGRKVDVTLRGKLSERVIGGSYALRVTYLGATLLQRSGKLAEVVQLPLPAGKFRLHKQVPVPNQAPSGKYTLRLTAANQKDKQLLCVSVPFEVN